MKETGLLFTPENYTKTARGLKSKTRRIMKPQPFYDAEVERWRWLENPRLKKEWTYSGGSEQSMRNYMAACKCPYGQAGDRLFGCMYIPGVPHTYCASGEGVIYSRARGDWRPLKSHSGNPYPAVTIMDGKKKLTRTIHTLICSAFYGPSPFHGAQVRHLDGDYHNSRPDNLCWGTQEENWNDRKAHGNGCEGEKHHDAKFTDEERAHIRWSIERGLVTQHQASRVLGVTQSTISEMMNGAELRPVEQIMPSTRLHPLWLEITDVRVERVQEITETDAIAEGCCDAYGPDFHVGAFRRLWESIHGPGSWERNDWVWVLSYKKVEA